MLQILPLIEQNALFDRWDFAKNVRGNQAVAASDISIFYCPSRRSGVRPEDQKIMFPDWARGIIANSGWLAGGNDYAGCVGAQNPFTNPRTYDRSFRWFCGPDYVYDVPYVMAGTSTMFPLGRQYCQRGILVPNLAVLSSQIIDGLSNTIMVGEVLRIQTADSTPGHLARDDPYWGPCHTSTDGWAAAGPNTLFDTSFQGSTNDDGQPGGFNTGFFESAGSDHASGAHFGMADGSVQFIHKNIDQKVYANLGSMADGQPSKLP
jgi:hypothetical protein